MSPRIALVDHLADPARESICGWLRNFNEAANPVFWAAREDAANVPWPLYAIAFDDRDEAIGGLLAETQFAWLKVHLMAVDPQVRRQGIGRALLAAAEREAVVRGCRYAYADTMSYQAPAFYERAGYTLAGRLPDWDSHGHDKLFFIKHLSPSGERSPSPLSP